MGGGVMYLLKVKKEMKEVVLEGIALVSPVGLLPACSPGGGFPECGKVFLMYPEAGWIQLCM